MCYFYFRKSTGLVQEFLSAIVVVSPDSMTVERCFSTYNILFSKSRTSTNQSTLFERLIIYWNGVPTAKYDPRQAVTKFFNDKKRRESRPSVHIYKEREFISKFFFEGQLG